MARMTLKTLGWREWIGLSALGIETIKCKVDTGARSSALHTSFIDPFERDGVTWVRFGVNPRQRDLDYEVVCEAAVSDRRPVRDSGGHRELRYVIVTPVTIGRESFDIELTLTHRKKMLFRMLLGRTALKDRFIVDSARSYVSSAAPVKP